jgi:hypothetical protein
MAARHGCQAWLPPGKAARQGCQARLPGKAARQGCQARLPGKAAAWQGCQVRLPGKAARQGCQARLPGKAARHGCQARLPGKAAGQGCRARLLGKGAAMVQCAESMVKLVKNAVFCLHNKNTNTNTTTTTTKQKLDQRSDNACKNLTTEGTFYFYDPEMATLFYIHCEEFVTHLLFVTLSHYYIP